MLYTDGDSNKYVGMAGRTVVCRISVISEQRLAHFFTNLARWKFLYKNRLVEILRES